MARIPNALTATVPAALTAASGLVGGYGVARWTGNRQLGGAVLAVAGAGAAAQWHRRSGAATAAALTGLYVVAFGGSHPLAKRIGAWPSVLAVTGVVAAASAVASAVVTRPSAPRG
ncbi:hypothetical protein PUR61_12025 [Streptomyces sp. BE20]|uniref:hypothetical protein n=1 Tax=Streptomycetaceae TaxID=2062 RepID=UPI002E76F665|nr:MULTISPECIES: hypothetical protein [unclassified Streptomyces]MED7947972.1 hypothetical protein [Streptomyces sp. BE303]MEE1822914.1 hypothetical protein [Streptomyces sp. BE20]